MFHRKERACKEGGNSEGRHAQEKAGRINTHKQTVAGYVTVTVVTEVTSGAQQVSQCSREGESLRRLSIRRTFCLKGRKVRTT